MEVQNKATRIDLFSLKTPQMRAFHMSWFAFFLCFFAWFGIAPLMKIIRDELALTPEQVGNTGIAAVAITIIARLVIGSLCDKIGPRLCYTGLLVFASIPVMLVGLADSYTTFLLFRLAIGVIGASFVITQYHTSVMFAPNVVGTANATSAGWGNLGGGVTQIVMPLILAVFVALGFGATDGYWPWRLSMVVAGGVCLLTGLAYYLFTTDLPNGNFKELRARGELESRKKTRGSFWLAAKDYRVWALFFVYAACFGIELTINQQAALYYGDNFNLGLATAGLVAGLFGLMNIFARTLGGYVSDRFVQRGGLRGRVRWLFFALLIEGVALVVFSQMTLLWLAIPSMIVFSLFVQMSEGATYSVVPFINKKALGAVAGIVGAGGNMGAVAAGFLFKVSTDQFATSFLILGGLVTAFAFFALAVRFSPAEEAAAREEGDAAMARRREELAARPPRKIRIPGVAHIRPMDVLRVYLGVALMIKGIYFVMNLDTIEHSLTTAGSQVDQWTTFIAWGVVFAHVIGGISLALGFVTRVAAGLNAIVVLGAVGATVFGTAGEGGLMTTNVSFQFTFFVFVALCLVAWRGSGPFSLDRLLRLDEGSTATTDERPA